MPPLTPIRFNLHGMNTTLIPSPRKLPEKYFQTRMINGIIRPEADEIAVYGSKVVDPERAQLSVIAHNAAKKSGVLERPYVMAQIPVFNKRGQVVRYTYEPM